MNDYLRNKVWNFSLPFYDDKDIAHGVRHIERILKEADKLASKYPDTDREIVFPACCFHGFVCGNEEMIRTFLKEISLPEEQVDRIIIAAIESQVKNAPETLEGKIVHDAHMIEGGITFSVVKCLIAGTARGQSLEETLDYMKSNILNKGQCYTTEAIKIYTEKQAYLKEFLETILRDLGN